MVMYIVDLEARINDALALRDYVQVTALCKLHEAAVQELDSMRCGMVTA
jgi:UDP-glucose 4-epimerase